MKVIFGIDSRNAYKPAMQLFARFRFEGAESVLAHFVNAVPTFSPIEAAEAAQMQAEYSKAVENAGLEALDLAKDEACMRDIHSKSQLRFGPAASGLSEMAQEFHADMVAVGAERGSVWSPTFLGSVSRGLTIGCHSSILVAKGLVKEGAPLKVVLATDHSPESRRWLRKFLGWHAHGISEINVVTAFQVDDKEASILQRNLPGVGAAKVELWIEEHLRSLSSGVVDQLRTAGYRATSTVACGKANDVIRHAMQDTESDVLVLGAQGHGFIQRLLVGSTSLHQVVAEPYPVLVVRS
jgi:nucleotide-binding universal stress UspA family protein